MINYCQACYHTTSNTRKAISIQQVVDERQSLQTLHREEKTSARSLTVTQEAHSHLEDKKSEVETEASGLTEHKAEVPSIGITRVPFLLANAPCFS